MPRNTKAWHVSPEQSRGSTHPYKCRSRSHHFLELNIYCEHHFHSKTLWNSFAWLERSLIITTYTTPKNAWGHWYKYIFWSLLRISLLTFVYAVRPETVAC